MECDAGGDADIVLRITEEPRFKVIRLDPPAQGSNQPIIESAAEGICERRIRKVKEESRRGIFINMRSAK